MPSNLRDSLAGRSLRTLALLAAGALVAGCSSAGTAGTASSGSGGKADPVKVGLVYSRSGLLAAYGKQYEEGFTAGLAYATHGTGKVGGPPRSRSPSRTTPATRPRRSPRRRP